MSHKNLLASNQNVQRCFCSTNNEFSMNIGSVWLQSFLTLVCARCKDTAFQLCSYLWWVAGAFRFCMTSVLVRL